MKTTKAQQHTAVGEGLALGAWMLGVERVNGDKTRLELDFRAAWREWPYAHHFTTVKAGPAQDDVLHILRDSASRRGVVLAHWEGAWPFVPTLHVEGWDAREVAEKIMDEVPAQAWADLVRLWLQRPRARVIPVAVARTDLEAGESDAP